MSESGSSVADDGDPSDDDEAFSDSEQTGSQEAEQLYQPKILAAKDLKNRRSGCPAEIRLNARLKAGELEVTVKNVSYNHELTDERFKNLPENRRLSGTEAARVISLQKSGVPTKAIQLQMTKETGKPIQSVDIQNIRTKTDTTERGGRTEEQLLDKVLGDIRIADPEAFIALEYTKSSPALIRLIVIVMSAMKQNFLANPSIAFLDGTYKINLENYCLYAMIVQNRHGKGRPVALGFFASETAEHLKLFFDRFKECHTNWRSIKFIFVDKDYNKIFSLEKNFQEALCLWHVLAYLRKQMTRGFGKARAEAYVRFYDAVYAESEDNFGQKWELMMEVVSEKMKEYMTAYWYGCREKWSLAFRRQYRLVGNNTNNYVESFFRAVKAAIKLAYNYLEYVHETQEIRVNHAEYAGLFEDLGKALNDFAVRLLYRQVQIMLKSDYTVERFRENTFTVTNTRNEKSFAVAGDGALECDCDFACAYGLTCRHVMVVHRELNENLINAQECIGRYDFSRTQKLFTKESSRTESSLKPMMLRIIQL
ncbi:hypothetical protein BV898_02041 [Hypsibius exemplaris]|uniref:SWIM-type domain-containing protein n=1 Tax=Hypsibius exemplaris TaxID=2072580 RepID=A0A1W0X972_HYPEX|nr:hypothetical protein BV898_02041 [Hypsibius exemplaris]